MRNQSTPVDAATEAEVVAMVQKAVDLAQHAAGVLQSGAGSAGAVVALIARLHRGDGRDPPLYPATATRSVMDPAVFLALAGYFVERALRHRRLTCRVFIEAYSFKCGISMPAAGTSAEAFRAAALGAAKAFMRSSVYRVALDTSSVAEKLLGLQPRFGTLGMGGYCSVFANGRRLLTFVPRPGPSHTPQGATRWSGL